MKKNILKDVNNQVSNDIDTLMTSKEGIFGIDIMEGYSNTLSLYCPIFLAINYVYPFTSSHAVHILIIVSIVTFLTKLAIEYCYKPKIMYATAMLNIIAIFFIIG